MEIKLVHSTPYNPTGNALSERVNVTIGNTLRMDKGKRISDLIPAMEMSINATVNRTLGVSPEQVVRGYATIDPLKRVRVINLQELRDQMKLSSDKEATARNKGRILTMDFQQGDWVYARNPVRSKLDPYWSGPFQIKATRGNPVNVLQLDKQTHLAWINIKQLKKAYME